MNHFSLTICSPSAETSAEARRRWLLFCVLLGIYLLVYVSAPTSIDGAAILAVSANLVEHGRADIAVLGAPEALLPPPARMGSFGPEDAPGGGALYSKKGPTPSLAILPLVAAAHLVPGLPIQAAAMLFNPLVLALTAVVVHSFVRRMGFGPHTALITGLILGLATFGLTYAKTLFAEPLAGLLLLWVLRAAYDFRHGTAHPARTLAAAGTAFGLLAGINLSYLVMVPLVGLYTFGRRIDCVPRRHLVAASAPVIAALALLGAYNWARFGSPLSSGYNFAEGEGFNRPLLFGLYGLLLSPYRGVFWYNPVLLLAIPGAVCLRRRSPRLTWMILALAAAQALTYASWWSWHGGIVWGPRFLLPVTPLAALLLAPVIESVLARPAFPRRAARWRRAALHVTLAALVLVSLVIQAAGALYSHLVYLRYLKAEYGTGTLEGIVSDLSEDVMFVPQSSPVIGQLAVMAVGWQVEPAWAAHGIDGVHLLAALVVIGLGLVGARVQGGRAPRVMMLAAAGILVGCLGIVVVRQRDTAAYRSVQALDDALHPHGTVVAATTLFGHHLIDLDIGERVISMNAPTAPDDPLAAGLWTFAKRQSARLWLLTWFPACQPENWQEAELWQHGAFVREVSAAQHRALLFDLAPGPEPDQPGGQQFGSLRLETYGVQVTPQAVRLTLRWSAAEPVEGDYTWFVHLLDGAGNVIAQQDRAPMGGCAPTSAWTPGQPVTDRLSFPLNASGDTSAWALRIGFVDPASGERLPVTLPTGEPQAEGYVVLPLHPAH